MTEGRLEVESKSQECLVIIKREVTSNNLPKRRVLSSTHGVVGGRRLVTASYPIVMGIFRSAGICIREKIFCLLSFPAIGLITNMYLNLTTPLLTLFKRLKH